MLIEQYRYKPADYDIKGLHKESRQLFIDIIGRWEKGCRVKKQHKDVFDQKVIEANDNEVIGV